MKQRLTFYLFLFLLALPGLMPAQSVTDTITNKTGGYADTISDAWRVNRDTVPFKTGIYIVKKKGEKLLDIANKLKTDPQIISNLNGGLSIDSVLSKGQQIVYVKNETITAKSKAASNKKDDKQVEILLPDTTVSAMPVYKVSAPIKIDTELIQNQILLTDATLDLNRTLLQGIQASLDSLNVKDRNVIDEKNISLTIHRMQRQRDKAILTPVLLHMQDSLKNEIEIGEKEKAGYEDMLGKNVTYQPIADNASKVTSIIKDTIPLASTTQVKETTKAITPIIAEVKEQPETKKDTIAPVFADAKVENKASTPVHIRPVIEAPVPNAVTETPVMHWETAKAIYYGDDTASAEPVNELTLASPEANGGRDTAAYKPEIIKADSAKQQAGSEEARSVRAKYFYTRALKDVAQKNYSEAVSYLKKAIDLSPKYYEACLLLGEADAHSGYYTKALNEFKYCQTIDSTNAILFYKMGVVQIKLKQKAEALSNFNIALKLNPEYIPAIISRAAEYADKGQYKTAIKEYTKVLQLDPSYHTVYKQRAMCHYALKNYELAIDDFSRFLIFNETDGSVYYHRGIARIRLKQTSDACADFLVSTKLGYRAATKAQAEYCK